MRLKTRRATAVSIAFFAIAGLSLSSAFAQNHFRLQYGFKKGGSYAYRVKIVAQLPDEEDTHEGVLTYSAVSSDENQFALNCHGNLLKTVKSDSENARPGAFPRGGFGGPPIARPPHFGPMGFGPMGMGVSKPEITAFNRQGEIITFGESSPLPLLLGDRMNLIVEALPAKAEKKWDKQSDASVVERSEMGPFPFARPFGPGAASETSRSAKERVDYTILEAKGNTVRIEKKSSLKTVEEGGKHYIDMSGEGEFEFDLKEGVVKSETMKYEIHFNQKNLQITVPITLTFRLFTADERAEMNKNAAGSRATPKPFLTPAIPAAPTMPLSPPLKEMALKELRSGEEAEILMAAMILAECVPDDDRAEIARALCQAYKQVGDSAKLNVLGALDVWYVPEAKRILAEAGRSKNKSVREKAAAILGKHKSTAAKDSIAKEKKKAEKPASDAKAAESDKTLARTWRDASGTYELEAIFVKAESDKVTLKKSNGKTIALPLEKLSKEDREYIEELLKKPEDAPENPFE